MPVKKTKALQRKEPERFKSIEFSVKTPQGLHCNGCPFLYYRNETYCCLIFKSELRQDFAVNFKKAVKDINCNRDMMLQITEKSSCIEVL